MLVLANKNLHVYCRKVCLWNSSCHFHTPSLITYISTRCVHTLRVLNVNSRVQVCISFSSEGSKHKMEWPMGLYVYFSLEIMRKMYDFFLQNMESRLPTTCRLTNGIRLSFKHVCSNLPAKNQRTTSDLSCEIERFCRTRNEKKRKQIKTNGLKNLPTVGLTI